MNMTATIRSEMPAGTILCVDDEPNILASLRRLFRRENYKVLTAGSAAAGWAVLEEEHVDIVISDRWLPRSCRPELLKADRRLLSRTGGLAIDLAARHVTTVAQTQGEHGWWRAPEERPRYQSTPSAGTTSSQASESNSVLPDSSPGGAAVQ